jgi:dTDP-4-dehydrorhamnose reductase
VRLLVTGGNGQVGWELRRSLAAIGDVIALDRKACDLSRPHHLPGVIKEVQPDVIVNAAAYTAVDQAEEEEELATLVNGTAVGVLATEARKRGALLVHYSTDYVFDGTKDSPYTEDDPPCPINAYGRSKLAGDLAASQSAGNYLILRTSWVFAARGHNFLQTILRLAWERDELAIVADQIGAPTWARDIADATALIIQHAWRKWREDEFVSGIFNLTSGGATSWCGFAEAILDQAMGRQDVHRNRPRIRPIASSDYPRPAARPKNSRLTGERLHERFGIALPEWRQALALCMQDMALAQTS